MMDNFLTSYIDTSEFGSLKVTKKRNSREPAMIERPKVSTIAFLRHFHGVDIDEYRAKHGKEEGEAKFFFDNKEDERHIRKDNMFLFTGAALLWQFALANGTATANSAQPAPTYLTNANTYLYVSDGNPSAVSGTVSVNNGSGTVTFSTSQTGLLNYNCIITPDSSSQVYTITGGSGTSWTISPVFGGATASGSTLSTIVPVSHSQTIIPGNTNIANQVADSGFPTNPYSAQSNTITGATNATPVVLTVSGADINSNDIVSVVEILGNTSANGTYVANPASSSSITLLGSAGSGSYTSGGLVTKKNVFTTQSTFGTSSAIFMWNSWGMSNGNGSNKIFANSRIVGLGSKASGVSSALKIGISIS